MLLLHSLDIENMKKVTLFVTWCNVEIAVNYPYNPCHRLTLVHFELTYKEIRKNVILCFCGTSAIKIHNG